MHKVYEILCKKAKQEKVNVGEYISCDVDFILLNDLFSTTFDSFEKLQKDLEIFDPKKFAYIFNSFHAGTNKRSDDKEKKLRQLDKFNKLKYNFNIYRGTWQQELIEAGLILPDSLIITCDLHSCALGAFSLLSFAVGEADIARAMTCGKIWLKVPEIASINIKGEAKENVTTLDIALTILKNIDRDQVNYKIVEFQGDFIDNCDVDTRQLLCDMLSILGPKTCFIQLNEQTDVFIARKNRKYKLKDSYSSNPDECEYSYTYELDVCTVVPMIATSFKACDIKTVEELSNTKIKAIDGFIGGCLGGQTKDIKLACRYLKGKKFPDIANLVVSPSSSVISREATNLGYQTLILDSGSAFIKPGCSSCPALRCDTFKETEPLFCNCFRDFCGRMKIENKTIYLCSPLTITASLFNGFLTIPS